MGGSICFVSYPANEMNAIWTLQELEQVPSSRAVGTIQESELVKRPGLSCSVYEK